MESKKTIWMLKDNYSGKTIAIFDSLEKGMEFIKSFNLKLIYNEETNKFYVKTNIEEAENNGLFNMYYVQGTHKTIILHLYEVELNKQLIFEHDE